MAALKEGQQYGLSAQDKINSNKSIVFVKLTDSALRSIEEYVKNKGGNDTKPTIQFQNSNGFLSLPHNGTNQTYGFTLSNVEADGPQGSFECLRQTGHRSLESVGCMHMKMHIHANEDSYENTRVKMAAVEKEKKGSCTKVIKPAGAHLGRKVKVKRPAPVMNPVKPNNSPPSVSVPTLSKNPPKPMNIVSNGSSNVIPPKKLPEVNGYQKPDSKSKSSPELLRQPIRDRIIHILAVRPHKRFELISRLMSEGMRDKDKKGITAILSQVGVPKGNIYSLANYCWNEVQDKWKFGTQDELEIIRRRKQQALSANAANESPPTTTTTNPSSSPIQKRMASEPLSVGQEPRVKKQRISHFSRTDNSNLSVKNETIGSNERLNFTTTVMNRKRSSVKNESIDSNERLNFPNTVMNRKSAYSPSTNGVDHEPSYVNSNSIKLNGYNQSSYVSRSKVTSTTNGSRSTSPNSPELNGFNQSSYVSRSKVTSTTNGSCSTSPHSPESGFDSNDSMGANSPAHDHLNLPPTTPDSEPEVPDYVCKYIRINSNEQRNKYKEDFYSQYQEYLNLHTKVDKIRDNFKSLEEHLRNCEKGSEQFNEISSKITEEYRAYMEDANYKKAEEKLSYLHSKLSHIKRLVMDYDKECYFKS